MKLIIIQMGHHSALWAREYHAVTESPQLILGNILQPAPFGIYEMLNKILSGLVGYGGTFRTKRTQAKTPTKTSGNPGCIQVSPPTMQMPPT